MSTEGGHPLARRLTGPFRAFGWRDGTLYALDRVLSAVSNGGCRLYVYDLMAQPVGSAPLLAPNRLKNLRFAEIPRGHPDIDRMPARTEIKALRFEQGARCLGVYRGGELLGFVWFCLDGYEEDEVRCRYVLPRPGRSVFDFDLYVFPEHRMGTAFMAVWHGANAYLSARGVDCTFSRVTRFNLASRRSHARMGALRTGAAAFLRLWRLEIMGASVAPWLAASWKPAQRVALQLAPIDARAADDPSAPGVESPTSD